MTRCCNDSRSETLGLMRHTTGDICHGKAFPFFPLECLWAWKGLCFLRKNTKSRFNNPCNDAAPVVVGVAEVESITRVLGQNPGENLERESDKGTKRNEMIR